MQDYLKGPGDARCNFCDGDMPCNCEPPEPIDYEADADARSRVDMPFESYESREDAGR